MSGLFEHLPQEEEAQRAALLGQRAAVEEARAAQEARAARLAAACERVGALKVGRQHARQERFMTLTMVITCSDGCNGRDSCGLSPIAAQGASDAAFQP